MKKFLCILLIVMLTITLMVCFTACNKVDNESAIIILPGLLAGGLYDSETGKPVWDPLIDEDVNMDMFVNHTGTIDKVAISAISKQAIPIINQINKEMKNKTPQKDRKNIPSLMGLDGNGVPFHPEVKAVTDGFDNPSRLYYGALANSKQLYDAMYQKYGDKIEVKMFNYDWRLSNTKNAALLENYINDKGYKNVYLVSHSMGGHLASNYLARSEANRNKVKAYVSFDTPFYGAMTALTYLEDFKGAITNIIDNLFNGEQGDMISMAIRGLIGMPSADKTAVCNRVTNLALKLGLPMGNIDSALELLPSYKLIDTPHYTKSWDYEGVKEVTGFIKVNDKYLTTKEEIMSFYASRDWSYIKLPDKNERYDYYTIKTDEKGNKIHRDAFKNLENYFESMDVAKKVNTLYVNGIGYNTIDTVCFDAPLDENGNPNYKEATLIGTETSEQGDGTVLLYSATLGKKANEKDVLIETNAAHFDPAIQFTHYSQTDVFNWLDKYIR